MPQLQAERKTIRYAWRVLSVTSVGAFLTAINNSTLNVALPVIARHFHATATEASWILLSYMLVNTVLILTFGRLADILGRRKLYLAGLALLTVASLACGLAPSAPVLIALRVVQAVGGACVVTNTTPLLADAFPSRLLSTGLGLNVTIVSAAAVLGPVVGGFFATALGWRWVFWFNVPIGILGLGWAALTLRRMPTRASREPFDIVGALLSLVVVGTLVVALSEGGALGWTTTPVLAAFAVFVLAVPLFCWTQWRRSHPLVDLGLFAYRERAMAYLATFMNSAARSAVVLLVSLYVQAAHGSDAFHAGLQVVTVALGMMAASPVAGRLAIRLPARVVSTAGLFLSAASLAALAFLIGPNMSELAIALLLAVIGIGSGLFLTPNTSSIMAGVPAGRRGVANGVRSMLQNAARVTSTALVLAIITGALPQHAKAAAYAGELSHLPAPLLGVFTNSYRVAFAVLAVLAAIGMVASLLRSPRRVNTPY
ncbi:MAG: DHA2 family efflux MFS transporter permease subunit [Streptosporangiales bacterium]